MQIGSSMISTSVVESSYNDDACYAIIIPNKTEIIYLKMSIIQSCLKLYAGLCQRKAGPEISLMEENPTYEITNIFILFCQQWSHKDPIIQILLNKLKN